MSAYDLCGITNPGKNENLALIVPVPATFTIACDDSQQQIDVADTTQTSRDLTESEVAFAERATYITRAATVVDIASRAARLQPEALDTLDALGCDITMPEELSTADGSCDETGTDVFVIDVTNCTSDYGDSFDMSIAVGGEGMQQQPLRYASVRFSPLKITWPDSMNALSTSGSIQVTTMKSVHAASRVKVATIHRGAKN